MLKTEASWALGPCPYQEQFTSRFSYSINSSQDALTACHLMKSWKSSFRTQQHNIALTKHSTEGTRLNVTFYNLHLQIYRLIILWQNIIYPGLSLVSYIDLACLHQSFLRISSMLWWSTQLLKINNKYRLWMKFFFQLLLSYKVTKCLDYIFMNLF